MLAKRISIVNFKGGVGKTTLAVHLAYYLAAMKEKKVLLVDVDHQSSLSLILLKEDEWKNCCERNHTSNAIFEAYINKGLEGLPDKSIIFRYGKNIYFPWENLDLLPSDLKLDETEIDLASTTRGDPIKSEWEKRTLMCHWLDKNDLDEEYDYIIFDCPPATKIVTQNAIVASQGIIIPTILDDVSIRGLPHLIGTILKKISNMVNRYTDFLKERFSGIYIPRTLVRKPKPIAIVPFRVERTAFGTTNISWQILGVLEEEFSDILIDDFDKFIYKDTHTQEALSQGQTVFTYSRARDQWDSWGRLLEDLKGRIDSL